jgi:hypothetical protein
MQGEKLPGMRLVAHYTWIIHWISKFFTFKVKEKHIMDSLFICSHYQITLAQRTGLLARRNLCQFMPTDSILFKFQLEVIDFRGGHYMWTMYYQTLGHWDPEEMWLLKKVWSNRRGLKYHSPLFYLHSGVKMEVKHWNVLQGDSFIQSPFSLLQSKEPICLLPDRSERGKSIPRKF